MKKLFPSVMKLEFYATLKDKRILHFSPESRYHATVVKKTNGFKEYLNINRKNFERNYGNPFIMTEVKDGRQALLIPLFSPDAQKSNALAIIYLASSIEKAFEVKQVITKMCEPLQVAVEREIIYYMLDQDRQKYYEHSIRDTLTGLFSRYYMKDIIERQLTIHDRDENATVSLIMFDIDFFKKVNDSFGHSAGDSVLRSVAKILLESSHKIDLQVRLGGEEFAIFTVGCSLKKLSNLAEKIRKQVSGLNFEGPMKDHKISISAGTAIRHKGETLDELLHRTDIALYEAKKTGRNKICHSQ
jgi:diguanylate cyclase (GGDEF)-like protein